MAAFAAGASRTQVAQKETAEGISTHDVETPFKLQAERNLVLVRVVVRDARDSPVGNLRKEDFQVFDRGKLQNILHFSVEKAATKVAEETAQKKSEPGTLATEVPAKPPAVPLRFVAFYFDDVHTSLEGMQVSRNAADHYLATSLRPGDRVGLFTSSGRNQLDFTDDLAKLNQALYDLRPNPTSAPGYLCADIPPFQAYLIVQNQEDALDLATYEAMCRCEHLNCSRLAAALSTHSAHQASPGSGSATERDADPWTTQVKAEAYRIHDEAEGAARNDLREIESLIRRMTLLPGQRTVVIVSGGFLTLTLKYELDEVVDRALRANVILNALDARGLYENQYAGLGESKEQAEAEGVSSDLLDWKRQMMRPSAGLASDGMVALAVGTGGVFFENSNDFEAGFRRMASVPEVYYVLAFSPQNLKLDGAFHSINVKLVSQHGLSLQARRGYCAPKNPDDPAAQEREEMRQAILSQDEVHELPAEVHTRFFMKTRTDAQLDVLTRLDMRQAHFRKQADLNLDNLTCMTALFDRDGHVLSVLTKSVQMKLRDQTLTSLLRTGATLRTRFDVKPGTYLVRTVIRETDSGRISSLNSAVEIPY